MTDTKDFHLGDIMSAATGILLSPRHVAGLYDILNYMTGDKIYTHQIPRAIDECSPYLLNKFPWIEAIDTSIVSSDNFKTWLNNQVEKYGEVHPVHPIHFDDHECIDPVEEINTMVAGKVIVITK